jgi:hypothetical protein
LNRHKYSLQTQEEDQKYVRKELNEALSLIFNEIKKSKYKRNIYRVIYAGMNGHDKIQSVDDSVIDEYIQTIEKKCFSIESTATTWKSIF